LIFVSSSRRGDTVDQLRSDIDSGRTGDKVPAADPAAAPLGTDEEAAGTPIAPELVASTRRLEKAAVVRAKKVQKGLGASWILLGFVGVLAALLVGWGLLLPV
jgi:hypothetical protein